MKLRAATTAAVCFACTGLTLASAGGELDVDADPAIATIRPVSEGRKLIRLPALEFELGIHAVCSDAGAPQSVSISVNDTQITLRADQLQDSGGEAIGFRVPARQVSPVAVDGFCPIEGSENSQADLLIRDAVTAHLSMRCASEESEWIIYASTGLDVTLHCETPEENQSSSDTDR